VGDVFFRVLGPVEVISDGHPRPLGAGTLVDLLALFATSPNQYMAADTLTEFLTAHPTKANHPSCKSESIFLAAGTYIRQYVFNGSSISVSSGHLRMA
jgi:hypothetical protein